MTDKTTDTIRNTKAHEGNAESRTLAKDWQQGKGHTKTENFLTPGDKENLRQNPISFDDTLEEKGEAPGYLRNDTT